MLHSKRSVKHLFVLAMGGAMLLSGVLLDRTSFAQEYGGRGGGQLQTLQGVISDGMCGPEHKGKDAAQCTLTCVKNGNGWALVSGSKVYTMEGKMDGINHLAGAKAKVTGRVTGDKINVRMVEADD